MLFRSQDFLRADQLSRFQTGPAQKNLRQFPGKEGQAVHLGAHIVKGTGVKIGIIGVGGEISLQSGAQGVPDQLAQFQIVVFEVQAKAKKATPKGGCKLLLLMAILA